MSILKEISESHNMLKSIAISTASSPLWYLSMFLLNRTFYNNSDIIVKTILSVSISVISSLVFHIFIFNVSDKNLKDDPINSVTLSSILVFFWKAILLFIAYSSGFLFNSWLYYYWYIIIFFIPIIVAVIIGLAVPNKEQQQ